ncbi:hypothetical protein Cri9333_4811 (plasmid) [Crinalium epipsammum PCC 9333]|uniref:Uncharacterized protein n=1 Tax=Crinalium epipsammum PCC 9333 TaxID=1173022 RepID=K9W808_9CYAN|nr:hypothetical protein [Crinalium epipsammum]AFZ15580.1 hypothetical protein Cri9333_4811 [Crinalium epipsammum PCC 9333]
MRWKPEPKTILQKFPNQHIMLYQGFTEILDKDNTIEGKGFVKLSWYPSPRITFKFVYYGEDRLNSETENYDLKLTELSSQSRLKIEVARTTHWGNKKMNYQDM